MEMEQNRDFIQFQDDPRNDDGETSADAGPFVLL